MLDFSSNRIMDLSRLGMRKSYGCILKELADDHEDIVSIVADVADSANLLDYGKNFPFKHINAGISEQNMMAMAAGLAKEGSNVFVTSFAPFVSLRVYEAIRTLICYMNLNVKIVALSSGFSLGVQGATHYALEDIAIMRAIPNLLVLSPADTTEMAKMMEYLATYNGPAYLRLTGIPGSALIHREDYRYDVNSINEVRMGTDVGLISTGTLVCESVRAARGLAKNDIDAGVINLSTLNPVKVDELLKMCKKYSMLVSVEEHNVCGGIGSITSEALACLDSHPRLIRLGTIDSNQVTGNYKFMLQKNGLDAKGIMDVVLAEFTKS